MNPFSLLNDALFTIMFHITPSMSLASMLVPQAGGPPALPPEIGRVVQEVGVVENSVFAIASALATMLIVVAGMMIMFDRDSSTEKRGQRLAFLRTVLIGYGIVLGAHVLISLFKQVVPS